MYLLQISVQAKAKQQLFKFFTTLFKHFYFSCLHDMIKERKVYVSDFLDSLFCIFKM